MCVWCIYVALCMCVHLCMLLHYKLHYTLQANEKNSKKATEFILKNSGKNDIKVCTISLLYHT